MTSRPSRDLRVGDAGRHLIEKAFPGGQVHGLLGPAHCRGAELRHHAGGQRGLRVRIDLDWLDAVRKHQGPRRLVTGIRTNLLGSKARQAQHVWIIEESDE